MAGTLPIPAWSEGTQFAAIAGDAILVEPHNRNLRGSETARAVWQTAEQAHDPAVRAGLALADRYDRIAERAERQARQKISRLPTKMPVPKPVTLSKMPRHRVGSTRRETVTEAFAGKLRESLDAEPRHVLIQESATSRACANRKHPPGA